MIQYVVYSTADKPGRVLRTGAVSSRGLIKMQAREGQAVIEGVADPRTQMVVGGQIVDRPGSRMPQLTEVVAGRPDSVVVPKGGKVRRAPAGQWQVCEDGQFRVDLEAGAIMLLDVRPPWPVMEYALTVRASVGDPRPEQKQEERVAPAELPALERHP